MSFPKFALPDRSCLLNSTYVPDTPVAAVLDALGRLAGGPVAADDRMEADLGLDSLELATLAAMLRERFGDQVDLLGFLAGLDLDQLIELTAGQLAGYVSARAKRQVNS